MSESDLKAKEKEQEEALKKLMRKPPPEKKIMRLTEQVEAKRPTGNEEDITEG